MDKSLNNLPDKALLDAADRQIALHRKQVEYMPSSAPVQRAINWVPTSKQLEALNYLWDNETVEVVYGGAAGSAKTYLGCAWLVVNCLKYPGSRWLMGRSVLKQLKESTLLTFFEVCRDFGLKPGVDYTQNAQASFIKFFQTGSVVYFKDLAYYPSDPDFDSLGSTEYTGAFIDEASQIRDKARQVVRSRLRYKLDEFHIKPKLLMTCNPAKNFLYSDFYKPYKEGKLHDDQKFIPALPGDNPYLPEAYLDTLEKLDKSSKERLLYGNWEYDDDPTVLMDYEAIIDLFKNKVEGQDEVDSEGNKVDTRKRYISCDVARFGSDKTIITVWYGWECVKILMYSKLSTSEVAKRIREQAQIHGVPMSHIVIDEDGIGGGVKDQLHGVRGFIANTRPFGKENYQNLKAQCAFLLAKRVNERTIAARTDNPHIRQTLIEELEQFKSRNTEKDAKLAIVKKEDMKAVLGRSPDIADAFLMRMFFDFAPRPKLTWVRV